MVFSRFVDFGGRMVLPSVIIVAEPGGVTRGEMGGGRGGKPASDQPR